MIKTSMISTLFVITLLFQGCSSETKTESIEDANSMISTNEYILTDLNSTQHIVTKEANGFKLENAKGKVVIFDIFATWCPPCRASATHLTSLQEKYKDDLVVIGITIEHSITNEKLIEFATINNAKYTLVNSDQNRPLIDAIATELKVGNRFPIPLMAMYKDGQFIKYYAGAIQEEFIESDIKQALGK